MIQLMQLLDEPLLVRQRQPVEAGIAAQQPFLLIGGEAAVLIHPVAEVSRRGRTGIGSAGAANAGIGRVTE